MWQNIPWTQNESELSAACYDVYVPRYPLIFKFTVSHIYMHDDDFTFSLIRYSASAYAQIITPVSVSYLIIIYIILTEKSTGIEEIGKSTAPLKSIPTPQAWQS